MSEYLDKTSTYLAASLIKDEMDYFSFHRNRFEKILKIVRDRVAPDDAILDIGSYCLHQLLALYFAGFKRLAGADLKRFNDQMRNRAAGFGINLKDCDLSKEAVPFPDSSFSLVLLAETLEHLNFHPLKVFKEIHRVLEPGGTLLITTPNLLRLNNRLKMMLGWSLNSDLREEFHAGTHYREYSAAEIDFLAASAGFKKTRCDFADFDYPNRSRTVAFVNKAAGRVFPGLKSNLIITAEK
jgi:SAM-dependent methyltransferase